MMQPVLHFEYNPAIAMNVDKPSVCNDNDNDNDSTTSTAMLSSLEDSWQQRSVTFSHVEVRHYAITLGPQEKDFPMSLDWSYTQADEYDLEEYEQGRSEQLPQWLAPKERQERISIVTGICSHELCRIDLRRRLLNDDDDDSDDDDDWDSDDDDSDDDDSDDKQPVVNPYFALLRQSGPSMPTVKKI
jgi:hypothetical protein